MHPNDRPPPYIGVTGVTTAKEHDMLFDDEIRSALNQSSHKVMIGVLASEKTLALMTPNRPGRYPHVGRIRDVFGSSKWWKVNLIHYNTRSPRIDGQLEHLHVFGGEDLDGFQLNVAWPDPDELKRWRAKHPAHRLVLQVSRKAYEQTGYTPKAVIERLRRYDEIFNDVLFDMSGGEGVKSDPAIAMPLITAFYEVWWPSKRAGIAGGLGADTLDDVRMIRQRHPDINLDAEGGLRDPATDTLDLAKSRAYLLAALKPVPLS